MADDFAPVADTGTPASDSAAPSAASDSTPEVNTRSVAESVFAEGNGDTPAASPAADPSTPPPTPETATRLGEDDDPEYHTLLASGSMPVDRHRAVLTNARNKTRAQVEQEFRAKYGWVDERQLDRARTDHALGLMEALDKNPEHTLRTIAQALGVSLTPPAAVEPEGPPLPDVRLDDGSEFYSAKQLAKLNEWKDAQYDKKLSALEARYQPLIADRHLSQLREVANTEAGTTLAQCRASWPSFPALEGEIKARMVATPTLSLEHAYIQAFAAKGLPALQQQYQTDHASQLHRKAAASMPGPGAARPVTPLRDRERSTRDIVAEEFARAAR